VLTSLTIVFAGKQITAMPAIATINSLVSKPTISNSMNLKPLQLLRKIGIAEGVSFLVLLLVAMPLKYIFDFPLAVKYVGWAHGLLFVSYVALAWFVKETYNWPFKKFMLAFVAAWLPLGTFVYDKQLKKEEALLLNR
jgi:integral membrane protein